MRLALDPGACLGSYEIKEVLGSGALGIVYRARQSSLDRDVALKVLAPSLALDQELVERFRREAKTAASLRHPHIVTIYDTGCADGCHYIAMELSLGQTLGQLPLPLAPLRAVEITRQLCSALVYAHQRGVIHRDLKPENVLVEEGDHAVLTDFGVARVVGQASLTLGGGPVGTPEFMSPEQARGETADARSDLYSLGLLLYFMLTGNSPFRAENALASMYCQIHRPLPPLPAHIPPLLASWIERCAAKAPSKRFTSGEEALDALQETIMECKGEPIQPSGRTNSAMWEASLPVQSQPGSLAVPLTDLSALTPGATLPQPSALARSSLLMSPTSETSLTPLPYPPSHGVIQYSGSRGSGIWPFTFCLSFIGAIFVTIAAMGPSPTALWVMFAVISFMVAIATGIGTFVDVEHRRSRQRRAYVMIEKGDAPAVELTPLLHNRLADGVSPTAERLGFRERQLKLRVSPMINGATLLLSIEASDRETGMEVGRVELEGDRNEALGMIEEAARHLCKQLTDRKDQLPGMLPQPK